MAGISDLTQLLRSMQPVLHEPPYGFAVMPDGVAPPPGSFALIAEDEGMTVVAKAEVLAQAGLADTSAWARISLTVHSELAAVGLTAAFARALADVGISANVVAGYHHDHIFVPWAARADALAALDRLKHV